MVMQLPAPAVNPVVDQQTTDVDRAAWVSPTGINLRGVRELRWFERHPEAMQPYENQWVAVKGNQVVKHGASFEEVHDAVTVDNIRNALIAFVRPEIPGVRDIA